MKIVDCVRVIMFSVDTFVINMTTQKIENKTHKNQKKHNEQLIISQQITAFWDFTIFLFTFIKWFILKNLKISITHLHHHWHKHFIAKKYTNKMRKNIFCFGQIIDLKKTKKHTLQKSIMRVYTSNHRWITMFLCHQKIQFVEILKRCDDCFY